MNDLCWHIRPATPADDLVALWRDVYQQQHLPLMGGGPGVPFAARGQAFVAEVDGAMAGFCCVDGDYIAELWVACDYQRRGIGAALLSHAESVLRARNAPAAMLTVLAVNTQALAFYKRQGWEREPGTLCSVTGHEFVRFHKVLLTVLDY